MIRYTLKQKMLMNYIAAYVRRRQVAPTYREMSAYMRTSITAVWFIIDHLIKLGAVKSTPNAERGIRITDPAYMTNSELIDHEIVMLHLKVDLWKNAYRMLATGTLNEKEKKVNDMEEAIDSSIAQRI